MKRLTGLCLLVASVSAFAAEPQLSSDSHAAGEKFVATSHGLLGELERFMHQQGVDANHLRADTMVQLMVDWYRFTPMGSTAGGSTADTLVYRYGGWSEGCATAFKLSLLRRVTGRDAIDSDPDKLAGITLMFEPSGNAELMPYTAVSTDWKSIDSFVGAIENSPAFKELAAATPMSVLVESGGVR